VANIWKNTACIAYSTTLERSDYMSVLLCLQFRFTWNITQRHSMLYCSTLVTQARLIFQKRRKKDKLQLRTCTKLYSVISYDT